jgi:hypothetical protein
MYQCINSIFYGLFQNKVYIILSCRKFRLITFVHLLLLLEVVGAVAVEVSAHTPQFLLESDGGNDGKGGFLIERELQFWNNGNRALSNQIRKCKTGRPNSQYSSTVTLLLDMLFVDLLLFYVPI